MERIILEQNVRDEVLKLLKKGNKERKLTNIVKEFRDKFNSTYLLHNDLVTKEFKNATCIYHDINFDVLKVCFNNIKISCVEEEFGISKDKKVLLLNQYKVIYNKISFVIFVIYEFINFKIESNNYYIQPCVFYESEVEIYLMLDDNILSHQIHTFDVSKETYLEVVSDVKICVKPQIKKRGYVITTVENELESKSNCIKKTSEEFNDILKEIFDIFIQKSSDINVKRDLTIEINKEGKKLQSTTISSDFLYNGVKIGEITKIDKLYEYEIIFKIDGFLKYVIVQVNLTSNELKKSIKIKDIVDFKGNIKFVRAESLSFFSNVYLLKDLYYTKLDKINSYVRNKKKEKFLADFQSINEFLSKNIVYSPTIIDISDKKLPFENVVIYNNVINEKKFVGSDFIKIFCIQENVLKYTEQKLLHIISKYIVIIEKEIYEVELVSNFEQVIYISLNLKVNLPVFFSKEVIVHFRKIDNKCMLNNIVSFSIFDKDKSVKKGLGYFESKFNTKNIILDIDMNYKSYFNDISFGFEKKDYINWLENDVEFFGKFDIFDFISNEQNVYKKRIGVKSRLFLNDDYENERKINVDLFSNGFFIGHACFDKNNFLELVVGNDDENLEGLADVNISEEVIGLNKNLYSIFKRICDITSVKLNENDKLTNIYIESIISFYNNKINN